MDEHESSPSVDDQDVPKVLARHSACHQCRKRKLKCCATRPICANCKKPRPRSAGGATECTWDERRDPSASSRRRKDTDDNSAKRAKISELEERVAAFEKALELQKAAELPSSVGQVPENQIPQFPLPSQTAGPTAWGASLSSVPPIGAGIGSTGWKPALDNFSADPTPFSTGPSLLAPGTNDHAVPSITGKRNRDDSDENIFQLIWPDWPEDLPSLQIVEHISNVFFDKVPTIPKMLHKATYMQSLGLPPKHANFPARALIHAILAIAAPHLPWAELGTRRYFPSGTPSSAIHHPQQDFHLYDGQYRGLAAGLHTTEATIGNAVTPLGRFQMWHRRKTFQGLAREFDNGNNLLQALQAQIIATNIDGYNAWWTDLWMEAGACIRMAVPIRINESRHTPPDAMQRFQHVLIPVAQTPLEQAIRDRTWWMAYLTERSVCMSTTWAECLADEEITVELPVVQSTFDAGYGQMEGTQTIQSPDLFSSHPQHHSDGLVFHLKAIKLWTDVGRWLRRYSRGRHSMAGYLGDPSLRLFLSQINAFRMTLPQHMRRPEHGLSFGQTKDKGMDIDLLTSMMVTHGITMLLGEPLITRETCNTDVAKMALSAIRAVLSSLYDITSTTFDLSLLPHTCSFIWFLCGRGLCRFIDASELNGDYVSANVFKSECQVFRLAMSQHGQRFPIANRHLKMLDDLLKLQSEATSAYRAKINVMCSKDQVFDPDFYPSADPSRFSSTIDDGSQPTTPSGLTPSNSLRSDPMSTVGQIPTKTTRVPDDFCPPRIPDDFCPPRNRDTFSSIKDPVKEYWTDQQASMHMPGLGMLPGELATGTAAPMDAKTSDNLAADLGFDISAWFDISNLAFDVDTMNNLASETGTLQFDGSNLGGSRAM